MEQLKKITQEEIAPTLHTGREDSPDLGTEGMQQLFDAHPSLNTNRQNENTDIQNRNNTVLEGHMNNTENPHQTTKVQVGLGSADNTSDMQKPVSTAQQAALNQKADKANTYTKTEVDVGLATKADKVDTYSKIEVDSKDTAMLGSAKTYADTGLATKANTIDVTKALEQKASMGYVDSGDLQALEQAKAYADKKVVDIGTGDMAQAVYDPRHKQKDVFLHEEDLSIHTEVLTGNWTPRLFPTTGTITTKYTVESATYSKVGKDVTLWWNIHIFDIGVASDGADVIGITDLPYVVGNQSPVGSYINPISYYYGLYGQKLNTICYPLSTNTVLKFGNLAIGTYVFELKYQTV